MYIEDVARTLLFGWDERTRAFRVDLFRGDGDRFHLRVAERRERAAEDAARVDIDRVVEVQGLRHRRVTVDDQRLAPVRRRPVAPHREPVLA